jgi:hypothetical protein
MRRELTGSLVVGTPSSRASALGCLECWPEGYAFRLSEAGHRARNARWPTPLPRSFGKKSKAYAPKRCPVNEQHALLRAELSAQVIDLRITPHVLVDDQETGAGLLDALTVTVMQHDRESLYLTNTLFRPLPEMHPRQGRTRGTGSFAVPVNSTDEAQAEADRYDPVPIFARHILKLWRGSMPPWAYYPSEASGGPHVSYGHYRIAMIREDRFLAAISFARDLGEPIYEKLEAAVLGDAGLPVGQIAQESRFEQLRGFLIQDPSTNISAAIHAKFVPDVLTRHRVDAWQQLACPYCERFFPREELAVVSYTEPAADFAGVAWGCFDCTGGFAIDITLDRMPTLEDGMRWTIHMLDKGWMQHPIALRGWIASIKGIFGQECDLWAKGRL